MNGAGCWWTACSTRTLHSLLANTRPLICSLVLVSAMSYLHCVWPFSHISGGLSVVVLSRYRDIVSGAVGTTAQSNGSAVITERGDSESVAAPVTVPSPPTVDVVSVSSLPPRVTGDSKKASLEERLKAIGSRNNGTS